MRILLVALLVLAWARAGAQTPDTRANITTPQSASATGTAAMWKVGINGQSTAAITISGLSASGATLTPMFSNDLGVSWSAMPAYVTSASGTAAQATIAADGQYRLDTAARTMVGLQVTVAGTGSYSIFYNLSSASISAGSVGGGGGGSGGTVTQGTGSSANPWTTSTYSGIAADCSNTTIGTTATLILDTAAIAGRAGGAFVMPNTGSTVFYRWARAGETNGANLTAAFGSGNLPLYAGGQIPFLGAPAGQLWALSSGSAVVGACSGAK